jgi:hypothetical protein
MYVSNEDVVINGTMIRYKFNEPESSTSGNAKAIYLYNECYYLVSITIDDATPPMRLHAHWGDDKAEIIM